MNRRPSGVVCVTVDREAREVEITELNLREFHPGARPRAVLEVTCSTGTYIRVLADDLTAHLAMHLAT